MKTKLILVSLMTLIPFCAMSQWLSVTGVVGYRAHLHFEIGPPMPVDGDTLIECENNVINERIAYNNTAQINGDIIAETPCYNKLYALIWPVLIEDFDWSDLFPEASIREPIGPRPCPMCDVLSEITFRTFYGNKDEYIREIFYRYKINNYQKELMRLQRKYDLEGFEQEVYQLNEHLSDNN